MSQVLEILTSLGINQTVFYQFGIFCVAFLSMQFIVFGPYLRAHDERMLRTVGGQEEAERLLAEVQEKENVYRAEARKLNKEIKEIFNKSNTKAKKEVDEIISEAKDQADKQIETAREELEASVKQVREEMKSHIPNISQNIQDKFARQ